MNGNHITGTQRIDRRSGVIFHPTTFPSPYGIGDLGPGARIILDFLEEAGQTLLQVLPLGPTGYADAPFSPFSSFAGNPSLISPDVLLEKGLLVSLDLKNYPELPQDRVDYGAVHIHKTALLKKAFHRWQEPTSAEYLLWLKENQDWLEPYCRFMAWKEIFGGGSWHDWPEEVRLNPQAPLPVAAEEILRFHRFLQWEFEVQWQAFRTEAHARGIEILGDLPLYVAEDSCDVWSSPDLFQLDEKLRPLRVAGVPPDQLCPEGQRWGNPLYHWENHEKQSFSWWDRRVKKLLGWVDRIKIDHFRALEAYWSVEADSQGAAVGEWIKAPGHRLLGHWNRNLGKPVTDVFFAENLGFITPEVDELLAAHHIPGMQVGTFLDWSPGRKETASGLPEKDYAYSSTHDTEPVREWLEALSPEDRKILNADLEDPLMSSRRVLEDLMGGTCHRVMISPQDLFALGRNHRMNIPGTLGNWTWRLGEDLQARLPEAARFLKSLSVSSGRNLQTQE